MGTPKSFMSHWPIFLASFVQERKFDTAPDLYVSIPIMTAKTCVAIPKLSKVMVTVRDGVLVIVIGEKTYVWIGRWPRAIGLGRAS